MNFPALERRKMSPLAYHRLREAGLLELIGERFEEVRTLADGIRAAAAIVSISIFGWWLVWLAIRFAIALWRAR